MATVTTAITQLTDDGPVYRGLRATDLATESAYEEVAGWLTPNPGGVGPMTRAMLIKNTYEAEVRRRP